MPLPETLETITRRILKLEETAKEVKRLVASTPLYGGKAFAQTISSGEVEATRSFLQVESQSALVDSVRTINNGSDGRVITIAPAIEGETINVRDFRNGGGNIDLHGNDWQLTHPNNNVMLQYYESTGKWHVVNIPELKDLRKVNVDDGVPGQVLGLLDDGFWGPVDQTGGAAGTPGPPGANGLTAYQIAVLNGFSGSEVDWLDSLVGEDGAPGAPGSTSFIGLTDVPASYAGAAGMTVVVNGTEDGLEFAPGGGGGAVTSVNGYTGVVVLDADDIGETASRVWFTPTEQTKLGTIAAGAEVNVNADWSAVAGDALILNKPNIPVTFDDLTDGVTNKAYTATEKTKLAGIATGAEVNVNADWNSVAGDSQILNKPSTFAPSAHAASHQHGGADEVATATPGANAIVKADADGKIGAGWIDDVDINLDNVTEGTTNKFFTSTEKTKLSGIAAGAEVNVNADWNSVAGDSQILNKPTISAFGLTLIDDAAASNARTTLGLGTMAVEAAADYGLLAGANVWTALNTFTQSVDGGDALLHIINSFVTAGSLDETVGLQFFLGAAGAAKIVAGKEEDFTFSGQRTSFLAFHTRLDGTYNEWMRINSVGTVSIGNGAVNASLVLDGGAGFSRQLLWRTGGVNRWILFANTTAEAGSNVGTDLQLLSRTDAGAALRTDLTITRSTGAWTLGGTLTNPIISTPTMIGDSEIGSGTLILSDPDVAHGMTTLLPTTVYGYLAPFSGTDGGLAITGASDAVGALGLLLRGIIGVTDPTDTIPAVLLLGAKKTGTTGVALGAAETVMAVDNWSTRLLRLLGNGDLLMVSGSALSAETIKAVDVSGLTLQDDGGNDGVIVDDGGTIRLNSITNNPVVFKSIPIVEFRNPDDQGIAAASDLGGLLWSVNDNSSLRIREDLAYIKMIGGGTWDGSNSLSRMSFGIHDSGLGFTDDVMVILSSGFVGIGTATPIQTLQLSRLDINTGLILERRGTFAGTDAIGIIQFNYAGDSLAQMVGSRDGANDAGMYVFQTQPAGGTLIDRMKVASDGRVTIGNMAAIGANKLGIQAGTAADDAAVGGTVYVTTAQTGNTLGGVDTLATTASLVNQLAVDNQSMWLEAWGTVAGNVNAKNLHITLGATTLATFALPTSVSQFWHLFVRVFRTGASAQKWIATLFLEVSGVRMWQGTSAVALTSGTPTLAVKGEGVATNDVLLQVMATDWKDANT